MKKSSTSSAPSSANQLSPVLQKFFVGSALVAFVSQIVQTIYSISLQYPNNQNLSSYVWWFIGITITMFIALVAYLSRRQRALTLRTVFDVVLVTLSVELLIMGLGWLTNFVQLPFVKMTDTNFSWFIAFYQGLPLIVTVPLLVIVIRRLRQQKQW